MSPFDQLTPEQKQTIHELQAEIKDLHLEADAKWAEYIKTGDLECFNEVHALDGEAAMLGMVAYIPKAGERKIGKINKLIGKIKGTQIRLREQGMESRVGVLESINAWREDKGLPPLDRLPRGVPGDSHKCTLAQAFKLSLDELGVDINECTVSGGGTANLIYQDESGELYEERPDITYWSGNVVSGFDDFRWLDLIDDEPLKGWAERRADEYWFSPAGGGDNEYTLTGMREALAGPDAEFRRRELTIDLGVSHAGLRIGKDGNLADWKPYQMAMDA